MKKICLGLLASVVAANFAYAADMPLKAPPAPVPAASPWNGAYVGLEVGGKWETDRFDTTCVETVGPLFSAACGTAANRVLFPGAPDGSSPHNFSTSGLRTGAFFGVNQQLWGSWVIGGEIDWAYYKQKAATTGLVGCSTIACTGLFGPGVPFNDSTSIQDNWDAAFRFRLGYAVLPNVLFYAAGGLALQSVDANMTCFFATSPACFFGNHSQTQSAMLAGYTVGGGIDWLVLPNVMLRGEYRYSDYGRWNSSFFTGLGDVDFQTSTKVTNQIATFGIAYKFP